MDNNLAVVVNGELIVQYDRAKPLPGQQRAYLDMLDERMDRGFELNETRIDAPDVAQRAQLITLHLIDALNKNEDSLISALCAWLANRLPDLKQVKVDGAGTEVSIDLVFDKAYVKAEPLRFMPPVSKQKH